MRLLVTRATVATVILILFLAACSAERITHEIPAGYLGWVTICYDVMSCDARSPAPSVRGLIRVSPEGLGCSPIEAPASTRWVRYYYVDEAGRRVEELVSSGWGGGGSIWGQSRVGPGWAPKGSSSASLCEATSRRFYVGSEESYKQAGSPSWFLPKPPLRC